MATLAARLSDLITAVGDHFGTVESAVAANTAKLTANTANVDAAGATMNTDTDVSAASWVLDEDTLASDSAIKVPTQQSVKAYVDGKEVEVSHGATAGTARPTADRVIWIGSVDPTNKQAGDRWIQTF